MDSWKTKQKIIVQVVSLFISIGLWLYVTNTENPIRTVEVSKVPVQLLNANALSDQGIALVPNQNIYVDLKVEGYSQDVYKLNKDDFLRTVEILVATESSFTNRNLEDSEYISNAKAVLRSLNSMSEMQAHKYLQSESMKKGIKMVDVAKSIISKFS